MSVEVKFHPTLGFRSTRINGVQVSWTEVRQYDRASWRDVEPLARINDHIYPLKRQAIGKRITDGELVLVNRPWFGRGRREYKRLPLVVL